MALSFFHMNVCSLTNNFDDFNIILRDLNVSFDIELKLNQLL